MTIPIISIIIIYDYNNYIIFGGAIINLEFSALTYRAIRDRIRAEDPQIDEQTLADTVEGLTDLHEIITAIIRSALADEALARASKAGSPKCRSDSTVCRIGLQAAADRQGRDDRTRSQEDHRAGLYRLDPPGPAVPAWCSMKLRCPASTGSRVEPRLKRQELLSELKEGADIEGVALSNPEPVLSVRTR